jgi:hypothetical protein
MNIISYNLNPLIFLFDNWFILLSINRDDDKPIIFLALANGEKDINLILVLKKSNLLVQEK